MTSRWLTLDAGKASRLGYRRCVYALSVNGVTQYVGQTDSLYMRLHQHRKNLGIDFRSPYVTVKYSLCRRFGEFATREIRLIAAICPPLNRAHKRNMNLGKPWIPESAFLKAA